MRAGGLQSSSLWDLTQHFWSKHSEKEGAVSSALGTGGDLLPVAIGSVPVYVASVYARMCTFNWCI